jgi:hypothetical protein
MNVLWLFSERIVLVVFNVFGYFVTYYGCSSRVMPGWNRVGSAQLFSLPSQTCSQFRETYYTYFNCLVFVERIVVAGVTVAGTRSGLENGVDFGQIGGGEDNPLGTEVLVEVGGARWV